ncbi:MFS general substrate transporter [Cyathus striatus]|nr:MFS general substrate transporter [Cyathus striatus]
MALDRTSITSSDGKSPTVQKGNTSQDACAVTKLTASQRRRALIQFIPLCLTLFLAGWNDGTTGPLLPRIRDHYNVGLTTVSLLFILTCAGFMVGAVCNIPMTHRLGFGHVIVLGSVLQLIAFAIQAPAPPFLVFVTACFINGFGLAIQDAQANGFVASLERQATTKMGIMQAIYGAGALIAPLISTQFSHIRHWSFHYLVSLGLGLINALLLIAIFRLKPQDECLAEIGQAANACDDIPDDSSHFSQILRLKSVHLMALFLMCYVGVEVTIGSWTVTYIINIRHGGSSSGYISCGFFAGLALGRVALMPVTQLVGDKRAVCLYIFLALGLELVVYLVPTLLAGAIAVSFVGFCLGPIYPIVMNHAGRVIHSTLLTGSIGWMAGIGTIGSALIPFVTGTVASRAGIGALQPILFGMMGVMFILWGFVPK